MAFYKIISWFFTVIIFKLNKKEAGSGAAAPAKILGLGNTFSKFHGRGGGTGSGISSSGGGCGGRGAAAALQMVCECCATACDAAEKAWTM